MQSAVILTLISFIITLIGFFMARYGIKQFMSDKCRQISAKYQICGFGGSLLFAFSGAYFSACFISLIIVLLNPSFLEISMFK